MILILLLLVSSTFAVPGGAQGGKPEPKPSPSPTKTVQSPLPAPTGHVNDFAHALNDETREQLEQALVELQKRSKIEFAVALVNTTNGLPIFDYSKQVFQGWNVGKGGDGILLFLAVDDHQWRIHTTRGLTRDLTEEKIKEVGAQMNPLLGKGQYGNGLRRGLELIIKSLAAKRGFAPINIPAPLLPGD
jgi:uncharacterized membrane protein YgcG